MGQLPKCLWGQVTCPMPWCLLTSQSILQPYNWINLDCKEACLFVNSPPGQPVSVCCDLPVLGGFSRGKQKAAVRILQGRIIANRAPPCCGSSSPAQIYTSATRGKRRCNINRQTRRAHLGRLGRKNAHGRRRPPWNEKQQKINAHPHSSQPHSCSSHSGGLMNACFGAMDHIYSELVFHGPVPSGLTAERPGGSSHHTH